MTWARDIIEGLRKILVVDERISQLSQEVKFLVERCDDLNRRVARLEEKLELLEHMGGARRKKLPPT